MSNNFKTDDQITLREQIRNDLERSSNPADTASALTLTASHILYKELSYAIGGAVIEVHRHLGPGQLESTYERALAKELTSRAIPYQRHVPIESYYKGDVIGEFVVDMIVNDQIILELKSVERLHTVHRMQLLSYLRATGLRLGLLINFNEAVVWRGIKRVVC